MMINIGGNLGKKIGDFEIVFEKLKDRKRGNF